MKTLMAGAMLVAMLGCSHGHEELEGEPSGATCPTPNTLTYDSFGRAFMESYCTRCHSSTLSGAARNGAPADHDFDSYLGVLAVAEHIDELAASGPDSTNEEMPPAAPIPTLQERQQLGSWLACELASMADGGVPDGI